MERRYAQARWIFPAANRLSTSGAITVAGGTLDLGGYTPNDLGAASFQGGTVQHGTISKSRRLRRPQRHHQRRFGGQRRTDGEHHGAGYPYRREYLYRRDKHRRRQLGTLAFAQGSLGTTGAITFNDGILQWLPGNAQDVSGRFSPIASGEVACFDTGTNSSLTLASSISGAGGIAKYAGSGTLILTGANTMASSEVDVGTLQMANAGAIGSGQEAYVESPGILDLHGYSPTIGGLYGNGTITTSTGTTRLTVTNDISGPDSEFDGVIQNGAGMVSLTKTGTCTFVMTGANTYTGGTTLSAGTLDLSGGNNRLSTSGADYGGERHDVRFGWQYPNDLGRCLPTRRDRAERHARRNDQHL